MARYFLTFTLVFCFLLQSFVAVGYSLVYTCCQPSLPQKEVSCCKTNDTMACTKTTDNAPLDDCSHHCGGNCCTCHAPQKTFFSYKKENITPQKISLLPRALSSTPYQAPHGISIAEIVWQPPRFLR